MPPMSVSRRDFLRGAKVPEVGIRSAGPAADTAPPPSEAWHIANRLMFGARPGDLDVLNSVDYESWLEAQLEPASINDAACDALLNGLPLKGVLAESPQQLYDRRNQSWPVPIEPLYAVSQAAWVRAANSERQLLERVVGFWFDHFNILGSQYIIRSLFPIWDSVIRANALGNFRQLLEAVARNPCMLYYLDNYVNTNAGPNENYARELYELHTLGATNYRPDITDEPTCNAANDADGDGLRDYYIDNDVYESARAFTGWTFATDSGAANRGEFTYVSSVHDRFNKLVLCEYYPTDRDAMEDGWQVLDALAHHPGTARHICTKLCRRFISDDPPQSIVDSAAQVFLDHVDTPDQIRRVLRHILTSSEFLASKGAKFKRPFEWMVAYMRALSVPFVNSSGFNLDWYFNPLGQPLYQWAPPDGPPDVAEHWMTSNGMLGRWNIALMTASGWFDSAGFTYSVSGVMPADLRTPREIVSFWAARLIGRELSADTENALMEFVANGRSLDLPMPQSEIDGKLRQLAGLCTMTPEFMWA